MCMTLGNTMHTRFPPFSQVSSSTCNDFRPRVVLLYMISSCLDTQKFSTVSQLFEQLWWCDLLYHMSLYRFLWFKMRLKQWCVWSTFRPLGSWNPCSSKPTWRPHQPPNVAGILNDHMGGFHGKAFRVDRQQTILVDVCCAWWEYAITTCHVNIWICVNLAKSLLSYTQHQRCEPPTIGIAKCLMKHPRGSCRWTMEWDPEGWMRLLLGKLIESWKKLQFTSFYVVCLIVWLFVCLFVWLFVCLFVCFFQFSI